MTAQDAGALDRIKSLFGLRRTAAASAARASTAAGSRAATAQTGQTGAPDEGAGAGAARAAAFSQKLESFAAHRDAASHLVAGKVHLINLNKVRERMGSRWPRFQDRIHGQIKAELERRLTRHDLFSQVDADSYAIVFGDCSELEARLKIAMLSEQILEKLFGEAESKDLEVLGVETLVTSANGEVAAEALQNTGSLMRMLDQAEVTELDPNTHRYATPGSGRRALEPKEVLELLGEVDSGLKGLEQASKGDGSQSGAFEFQVDRLREVIRQLENLDRAMMWDSGPNAGQPSEHGGYDPTAWVEFRHTVQGAISQLRQRAERSMTLVYERQSCTASDGDGNEDDKAIDLVLDYLPMWHAPSQKIGIYAGRPRLAGADAEDLLKAGESPDGEADLFAILDRLGLRKALQDLKRSRDEGHVAMVALPIHLSTLRRLGGRRQLVELCSRIPEELNGLLVWELSGAPPSSWRAELPQLTRPIRKFARAIFLHLDQVPDRLPDILRKLPLLRAAGVHEIGVDVATLEGTEADKLALLERLAVAAKEAGLRCYGHGFDSLSMTIYAVCLGFQHVSGAAISHPLPEPKGIQSAAMEAIYGRLAGANLGPAA